MLQSFIVEVQITQRFGNWHTIDTRMNRWSKSGVLDRVFAQLQQAQIIRVKIEVVVDGPPRFIWLPQMLGQS